MSSIPDARTLAADVPRGERVIKAPGTGGDVNETGGDVNDAGGDVDDAGVVEEGSDQDADEDVEADIHDDVGGGFECEGVETKRKRQRPGRRTAGWFLVHNKAFSDSFRKVPMIPRRIPTLGVAPTAKRPRTRLFSASVGKLSRDCSLLREPPKKQYISLRYARPRSTELTV